MKKFIKKVLLTVVLLFLIVWGAALIKCEILTSEYYSQFENAYQETLMLKDMRYFRVLNCDGKTAEVYYVSETGGDLLEFENRDGEWVKTQWKTVWSKSGSASDVVWPYWWQFFITGL